MKCHYILLTPGPCPEFKTSSLEEAKVKASKYIVLKRGWTMEWEDWKVFDGETFPRRSVVYIYNSKGRQVNSASLHLMNVPLKRGH